MSKNQSVNHDDRAVLHYFAGWGRAEPIRWLLAAAEIAFTEKNINSRQQLKTLADSRLLFGQVPLLEIDGLSIVETQTILRYIASRSHLLAETADESLQCEMIVEAVCDLRLPALRYPFKLDQQQVDLMQQMLKKFCPRFENIFHNHQLNYPSSVIYSVGNHLSYADVLLAECLFLYHCFLPGVVDEWPLCQQLMLQVVAMSGIKAYLNSSQRYPVPLGEDGEKYVDLIKSVLY